MVSITSKPYSFSNGTANDAAPVDASFTTAFNNDATLATAVTTIEGGAFSTATSITLNNNYSGGAPSANALFGIERGTIPNTYVRWNETLDQWEVTPDGTNYYPVSLVVSTDPVSPANGWFWYNTTSNTFKGYINGAVQTFATTGLPKGYRGTSAPVNTTTAQMTFAVINDRDSTNTTDIQKSTNTTLDTATSSGLNGFAGSANLPGTISTTSGSANVVGTGAAFTATYVVGDVIYAGTAAVSRRITVITDDNNLTVSSTYSTTASGQNHRRGYGRCGNTTYYIYSVTNGTTAGLVMSTRNVAAGQTLLDLPSGYTVYRQQPFAIRLDGSNNIIPFRVSAGWPFKTRVVYTISHQIDGGTPGVTNVLDSGTATIATDIDLSAFVPKISREADIWVTSNNATTSTHAGTVNTKSLTNTQPVNLVPTYIAGQVVNLPTDSNQLIQYTMTALGYDINVFGYTVTELTD